MMSKVDAFVGGTAKSPQLKAHAKQIKACLERDGWKVTHSSLGNYSWIASKKIEIQGQFIKTNRLMEFRYFFLEDSWCAVQGDTIEGQALIDAALRQT